MLKDNKSSKATLSEITKSDLKEVSVFLHNHMNSEFAAEQWEKQIGINWLENAPNHGYMLKQDGDIAGALCAIYSEQDVDGVLEKFCNPHSWCVLPEHRKQSVDLVLATIRQQGFHYTMFSPNKGGVLIFSYLKFKPLDNTVSILLNAPTLNFSRTKIIDKSSDAAELLTGSAKKTYVDHIQFPWLNLLAFRRDDKFGFIIYKKQKLKKLPCAYILYVHDVGLFQQCWPTIRTYLLMRHGFVTSKVEQRLLGGSLGFTLKKEPGHRKFYLSDALSEDDIRYVYSELMTLDI